LDGKIEYLYLDSHGHEHDTNLLIPRRLPCRCVRACRQVARAGVNYKFDFDYATLVNLPR